MQFLNSLTDNKLVTLGAAIAAFLVFAVLILLFVRLLFGNRLRIGVARGRQQRLGVVDAYDMDRQRQLVLVRRDNTEHLILIGGPNDLLIESTILRVESRERGLRDAVPSDVLARLPVTEARDVAPEAIRPPDMPRSAPVPEPARVSPPVPVAPPFVPPEPVATPAERDEPPAVPVAAPVVELASRETRLPDLFARMRAGRAAAPQPVPEEAAPTPPLPADAEFFETEIAKALAPSLRERPAVPTPPAPPPPLSAAHLDSGDRASDETAPIAPPVEPAPVVAPPPVVPPRPPFRPFPRRKSTLSTSTEPTPGVSPGSGERAAPPLRPNVPRPPPPPFFTRMTARGKEREDVAPLPPPGDVGESETKVVSQEPVTLFPEPNQPTGPVPRVEVPPTVAPSSTAAPRIEIPAAEPLLPASAELATTMPPAREPEPFREPAPIAPPPAAPNNATSESVPSAVSEGTDDPFEEEMARLLGRPPSKNG